MEETCQFKENFAAINSTKVKLWIYLTLFVLIDVFNSIENQSASNSITLVVGSNHSVPLGWWSKFILHETLVKFMIKERLKLAKTTIGKLMENFRLSGYSAQGNCDVAISGHFSGFSCKINAMSKSSQNSYWLQDILTCNNLLWLTYNFRRL